MREAAQRRTGKRSRCAIYTRKSTEEGLDQAFNSLDAQREACAAFIASQKHEGWTALATHYDDGGYSGGSMERPALKRLIADIEAGGVDVIVVYKVDRLTRSLADFAKLVEVFDAKGVSFVSIAQQFNTTSSMGRLTLNVLLSFAQFEREVIGERVRDKIAASKKKGMWMGGMPPLGYDVKDRKLVVNDAEANTIVSIFERYVALKSVHALRDELAKAGIASKRRARADGSTYGSQPFCRGALYALLQNRLYRGEIVFKGAVYPGQHAAIVKETLWDTVQATLAENRVERRSGAYAKSPSLLAGMVFDEAGERLTPTHAVKKGARYRYYISASLVRGEAKGSHGRRIPAGDLERLVVDRLQAFFADEGAILDACDREIDATTTGRLIAAVRQIGGVLAESPAHRIRAILIGLQCRVDVGLDQFTIMLARSKLAAILRGEIDPMSQNRAPTSAPERDDLLSLSSPVALKRVGREMRMLIEGAPSQADPDPSLLLILARAHRVQARLSQNSSLSVHDIARDEGVSAPHLYSILRLPWLAPDVTAAIVNGRQPRQLTAKSLMRFLPRLPPDWSEQRKLLGFPSATA
ncbi:recombinase family protein [Methylocella silvestris]|uniref:Recombinase family protein n=1 Tax=Methylocella silvestris TaxID=199596 RepID=A0A2J7THU0_METSI|nr:recombinase family protein [Methylocella silvestris]PNG26340.1 recombinase family protein [Methylocella silvestris]